MAYLPVQARPLLSRVQNFVTTTEPGLLAEYAVGGVAAYYLVGTRFFTRHLDRMGAAKYAALDSDSRQQMAPEREKTMCLCRRHRCSAQCLAGCAATAEMWRRPQPWTWSRPVATPSSSTCAPRGEAPP